MAKFSAIILTVAVIAIYTSLEVFAQAPAADGTVPLGGLCQYRAQCNANLCADPTKICCDQYRVALAGDVYAFSTGKCTCCATSCGAALAHGQSVTPNGASHADAYHQRCKI